MIQQPTSRKDALAIERLPDGGFVVTEHHRHASGYQDSLRFAAGSLADALAYISREMGDPKQEEPEIVLRAYHKCPSCNGDLTLGIHYPNCSRVQPEVRDHELGPQVTA